MVSPDIIREFRDRWLPHVTDSGLARIIELLETNSPLLIHGLFQQAPPLGCIATQVAWHHPKTAHFSEEAGIQWLSRIVKLNPATSKVIIAWDKSCQTDWELRGLLLRECQREHQIRSHIYASDLLTANAMSLHEPV